MRLHVALGLLVATFVESYVSFASADPSPVDGRVIESTEIRLLREAEHIQEDRGVNNVGEAAETLSRAVSMTKVDGGLLAASSKIRAADEVITSTAVKANEQLAIAAAKSNEQVSGVAANLKDEVTGGVAKATDEVTGGVAKSKDEVEAAAKKEKELVLERHRQAAEAGQRLKEEEEKPTSKQVAIAVVLLVGVLGAMTGWALHLANKKEVTTPLEPMSGSNLDIISE